MSEFSRCCIGWSAWGWMCPGNLLLVGLIGGVRCGVSGVVVE
jgi:hypothetical protein